jgi:membrane protease subunit HflK
LTTILAQPEGIFEGVEKIIDYQFGFKLSQTALYSLLIKALLPLIAFQIIVLLLLSCIVIVPVGERGFKERLGLLVGDALSPGIHFKYPYPFEKTYFCPSDYTFTLTVNPPKPLNIKDKFNTKDQTWDNRKKSSHLLFLSAVRPRTDEKIKQDDAGLIKQLPIVNLLQAQATIQYRISNPQAYYYNNKNPLKILKHFSQRELILYLSSHDGLELLRGDCQAFNDNIKQRLQALSERIKLGVHITSVSLTHIQPVNIKSFHGVIVAKQKGAMSIANAKSTSSKMVADAKTKGNDIIQSAIDYSVSRIAATRSNTDVFTQKVKLYKKYKHLYTTLSYLDVLENALNTPRKIIFATDLSDQVISIDLKSDVSPELLDFANTDKKE